MGAGKEVLADWSAQGHFAKWLKLVERRTLSTRSISSPVIFFFLSSQFPTFGRETIDD